MSYSTLILKSTTIGLLLGLVLFGWVGIITAEAPKPNEQTSGVTLPMGSAESGREAFLKLKCFVCHKVNNDSALPQPIIANAGPLLSAPGYVRTRSQLANSIISPSHDIHRGFEKSLATGQVPQMGDFSDTMTVRQLVDIVSYLLSKQE